MGGWAGVDPATVAWRSAIPAGAAAVYRGRQFYREVQVFATRVTVVGLAVKHLARRPRW
ncbi:hypothetical protein [Haloarcula sp. JP-L23]|uniref:hypothetical protein n=1 Tax=Haloarcula sp. JP-L23 TaxID=2716717 RepID=UPI00140EFBDE|nr:hypothetical protein G9465_05220 [Haloarcula sp. JP-L23]